MERISVSGKRLLDEFGRERIFNGINVCDKGVYEPDKKIRTYGHEWEKDLVPVFYKYGFNIIRLGLNWDAVEPFPGQYSNEYISFLRGILDRCRDAGIYVYLDMHQDLYSGFGYGEGDGAPAWATLDGGHKYRRGKFVWAEAYFWGKGVHRAFDKFWDNEPVFGKGLQDHYAAMWKHVAGELGSHPAVMGFDMMNEPFCGTAGGKVFRILVRNAVSTILFDSTISKKELLSCLVHKDKSLQITNQIKASHLRKVTSKADEIIKNFDLKKYNPFLTRTASAIREVNKDGLLIFENNYYSNLGIPCNADVKIDGKRDGKIAFAPHAYDLVADTPAYKYADNERIESIMQAQKDLQDKLNIPVIYGEWGGFQPDSEWHFHCHHILSVFDKWKWSNTYWAYFDGLFESTLMDGVLLRPYPRAVTGEIISYYHDRKENSFTLSYKQSAEFPVPTEVFIPGTIKSVETDGTWEKETPDGLKGNVLKIFTGRGEHSVKVLFGEE